MALNVPGVIAVSVFYVIILGTGLWAARKSRKAARNSQGNTAEVVLLGDRNINLLVGVFTMTATWVGGGFILGVAEAVYSPKMGLIWALMPLYYTVSFTIGGLFFAKPMRDKKYVTMLDPLQIKFGNVLSGALVLPCILVDVLWVSATLLGLGSTMTVILDLPYSYCVWISSAVAIVYTLLGGLYSVAYTDVIQLCLIFLSLGVAGGVLRGAGKPLIGAGVNLVGHYFIGLPIGMSLMFAANLGIVGFWIGLIAAVVTQSTITVILVCKMDWKKVAEEALLRSGVHSQDEKETVVMGNMDLLQNPTTAFKGKEDAAPQEVQVPATTTIVGNVLSTSQLVLRRGLAVLLMFVVLAAGIVANHFLTRMLK